MSDPMLGMLRRDAVEDFDAEVTIVRPDAGEGDPVWSDEENKYVYPDLTVYEGPCSFLLDANAHQEVQAGERTHTIRSFGLDVPYTVEANIGDQATVTDSPDGLAVGLEMRVVDVPKSDWTTVRRLLVEEVV